MSIVFSVLFALLHNFFMRLGAALPLQCISVSFGGGKIIGGSFRVTLVVV